MKPSVASMLLLVNTFAAVQISYGGNTWDGGGTSDLWSDAVNWDNDSPPAYGTLTFTGNQRTTNVVTANTDTNMLLWTGSSSWTLNNTSGAVISLFDNGGTQAKLENQSTGQVTINALVNFAASAGSKWAEINAVNGDLRFGATGALSVSGSRVEGVRLFGSGHQTIFDNVVNASGKWFATAGPTATIVAIGGEFTANDFYVTNGSTLKLNSGGKLNGTAVRLGGDFGATGFQNLGLGATFAFTSANGGHALSGIINTVSGNTSAALLIDSQNTSGTNSMTGDIYLDSPLKVQQASGGLLSISSTNLDIKDQKLTFQGAGNVQVSSGISNTVGIGSIEKNGTGTLTFSGSTTFGGETKVNAGTLAVSGSIANSNLLTVSNSGTLLLAGTGTNRFKDDAPVQLSGGTIQTAGLQEGSSGSVGLGALTLSADSVLDFSGSGGLLHFAASNGTSWSSGPAAFKLAVYNWDPGSDRLYFGNNSTALTSAQLSQITFFQGGSGSTVLGTADFVSPSSGELTFVPVPEPGTIFAGIGVLGLVAYRERRRFRIGTK